jgi:hypothetical protein
MSDGKINPHPLRRTLRRKEVYQGGMESGHYTVLVGWRNTDERMYPINTHPDDMGSDPEQLGEVGHIERLAEGKDGSQNPPGYANLLFSALFWVQGSG